VKGSRLIIPIVVLAVIGAYWWLRPRPQHLPEAYINEHSATLWSSMAQVKERVATLHYGEKVEMLERKGDQVEVRTAQGVRGWIEARLLMDPPLWERRTQLLEKVRAVPVQARGLTKVVSNVHIEPGRDAVRVYQFGRGVPLEIVARAVAEWTPSTEETDQEQKSKKEDWYLVRGFAPSSPGGKGVAAKAGESIPIAGWVLARFVELDLPGAIRDYASSAGLRVVAWFELNRVPDQSGEKPQYLVAGARGPEGQPCDFTMLRVYTWGSKRQRYETAYVESNLCAWLPIRAGKNAAGDPEFRFAAEGKAGKEERRYVMHQTVVRRLREGEAAHARRPRR
jgi:hypothetical protein